MKLFPKNHDQGVLLVYTADITKEVFELNVLLVNFGATAV